ncbi:hypothetical protein MTR_7g022330 [Medicago truncatula]|uniref:Uncharacterized protein n=1 Tax=Medicago truncatula TaxID=3880 RepID=G7KUR5_MEDTR|nr:hypothetical protein MTR_7g022330 [Medicago truncatula]
MEAVLIHQKCEKALKGEGVLPVTMSRAEKTKMVDRAKSAVVLCLGDKDICTYPIKFYPIKEEVGCISH